MWQGQHQTQPRGPRPQIQHPSQQAQQAPQPQPQTAYVQPYPAQDNSSASYYPNRRRWCLRLNKLKLQPSSGPRSRAPFAARPISDLYSNTTSTTDTPQTQSVLQQQHQTQAQMSHSPVETHASVQSQTQVQKQQTLTGPPFVIDSTATYQDQNAQAWTQYYAQWGTDPAGTEHFISVPGINGRTLSAHCGGTIGGRRTTSTTTASHIGRVFLARLRERFTWSYRYSVTICPVTQDPERQNSLPIRTGRVVVVRMERR